MGRLQRYKLKPTIRWTLFRSLSTNTLFERMRISISTFSLTVYKRVS
jgi:hypothetical protein